MYKDVRSRVRVGDGYSEEFGVGVGVHQGSVLSPLLFIIVLEAVSREFRIRNAVALREPCALTLSSGAPDALGLLGLLMKEKFQRLRLETKSLKLSQSSATLRTCSLQEVAASWLRSHAANVHGASSANCFPSHQPPSAPSEVRCTHHV